MTPTELAERLEARPDLFDRLNSGDPTALIELIEVGTGATVARAEVRVVSKPEFQQLADEFRRLAATAKRRSEAPNNAFWMVEETAAQVWEQAALMLEEKLS